MNTNIKKSFKVIFNSNDKVAGSTNSNAQFYIDWSAVLKDNQDYSIVLFSNNYYLYNNYIE